MFGHRELCGALAMTLVLGVACRQPPDLVDVEVDLTTAASAVVNGERRGLPVAIEGGSARIVQAGRGTVDLFLHLPNDARLLFELPEHTRRSDFSIAVLTAGSSSSSGPTVERRRGDEWEAHLAQDAGGPVRLRLENHAPGTLQWIRPRVVGKAAPAVPVLGSRSRPVEQPINVLLYVVDTLRADRLSVYGYERPTSPNLERLARQAVLFSNAYAPGPHTVPSITALFASRFPSGLGGRLQPDTAPTTLAEAFRRAGYDTAAFQANSTLISAHGYARGFDVYERPVKPKKPGQPPYVDAAELHERVRAWLGERGSRPFFLYVQSMDVHFPYAPPSPYRLMFAPEEPKEVPTDPDVIRGLPVKQREQLERYASLTDAQKAALRRFLSATNPDSYDGAIAYADHELALLFDALRELPIYDRTAIVITSDHGEPLWKRNEFRHGLSLYEELVHVPLLIILPWASQGSRVEEIVDLMDLAPTLLDLAGIDIPDSFAGRSLLRPRAALQAAAAVGERLEFASNEPRQWYVREGEWKLILGEQGAELFHLPTDPDEERDLSDQRPVVAGYLTSVIMDRSPAFRGQADAAVAREEGLTPAERRELEENLRALGYLD